MTTRISVGGGKYCYSGPTCQWHSATGAANVKKAISTAQKQIAAATDFEEMSQASEDLKQALEDYNATSEGMEKLQDKLDKSTDPLEQASLQTKLALAKEQAAAVEADEKERWGNPFLLAKTHTYEEATYAEVNPGMYSGIVGNKHGEGYMGSAELTKAIRGDLKEAQKAGYLPEGLSFSVSKEDYSGGRSVYVEIKGMDNESIYGKPIKTKEELQAHHEESTWNKGSYSENTREILERVEGIMDAYNSKSIHGEIDYFSVSYHSRAKIQDEFDRQYSDESKMRSKAIRDGNTFSKKLKEKAATAGRAEVLSDFDRKLKLSDGSVALVKGRVVAIPTENGQEVYNLSSVYSNTQEAWDERITGTTVAKIRNSFYKKKIVTV